MEEPENLSISTDQNSRSSQITPTTNITPQSTQLNLEVSSLSSNTAILNHSVKRDLPSSPEADSLTQKENNKPKRLKLDGSDIKSVKTLLQPINKILQNQSRTIIGSYTLNQLARIISASKQCENIDSISKLTAIPINNPDILEIQLRINHENTLDRSLKIRATKLMHKLQPDNSLNENSSMEH